MPSYTENLGLPIIGGTEGFDVGLINDAMRTIDAEAARLATGRAVRNWLINPAFTIDQRGQGEYSTSGAFCLDRWRLRAAGGAKVTKLARGVRLEMGTGGLCGLYQRIATQEAPEIFEQLAGKPVTLAAKIKSNTLTTSSKSGIDLLDHASPTSEGSGAVVIARKTFESGVTGVLVATGTMPETMTNAGISALIRTPTGENTGALEIEWMALYEGTYTEEDLPAFVPRGEAEELQECQRYYMRTTGQGWGYCTSATAARLNVPITITMRARPEVDNSSVTFTAHNNGRNVAVSAYEVADMEGGSVRLNLTSADGLFTKFTPLAGYASENFGFTADI